MAVIRIDVGQPLSLCASAVVWSRPSPSFSLDSFQLLRASPSSFGKTVCDYPST